MTYTHPDPETITDNQTASQFVGTNQQHTRNSLVWGQAKLGVWMDNSLSDTICFKLQNMDNSFNSFNSFKQIDQYVGSY